MADISEIKEGDLVEILLKENAGFFHGRCSDFFMSNSENENLIKGRFVSGYVSNVTTQEKKNDYFVLYPVWNKEKNKVALTPELIGFRIYLDAIESVSKK
jgi:hypothetical protein